MSELDGIPGLLPRATAESIAGVRKHVPVELQRLKAWVCSDRSPKQDKAGKTKSSKAPIDPHTGGFAKSNDPSTWGTFDEAANHALGNERCFGVGINLFGSDYVGLDLDHVVDAGTGELNEQAGALIGRLPATYTEVSPSGCGLRLFFRGKKPKSFTRSAIKDAFGPGEDLEVYDCTAGRYLTTTGRIWTDKLLPIATVTADQFQPLVDLLPKQAAKSKRPRGSANNNDLERARWGLLEAKILDPDCGYDGWLRVGVALKLLADDGLELWDAWSHSAESYDPEEINSKWPGLTGSSIASLFGMFDDAAPDWRDRYGKQASIEAFQHGAIGGADATGGHHHGHVPLGECDPRSRSLVLSPKRTLPTAAAYVREFHTHPDGHTLRSYAGQLLEWRGNRYVELEEETLTHRLLPWLHRAQSYKKDDGAWKLVPFDANPSTVKAAVDTLRSHVHLPASTSTPSWIDKRSGPPACEIMPCKSMSLHIPSGQVLPPTPLLFNTNALDFDFDPVAAPPVRWLKFLDELFREDVESVNLLQEWFGYCLVPDTSHQKMLMMVGPRRSGKGTIARVLTQLIGAGNVCGPTVGSLGGTFGLQPLLGRSLAVISDARFAGDNIGTIVERLLTISGEDAISIDRKFLSSLTIKLPTRFMVLTNELPRFSDSSTALAGRFLVLTMSNSFYGNEDIGLTQALLGELPGVLLWALEGWRRLHGRGRFLVPESSKAAVQDIEDLSSPVQAFVRERCVVGEGHRVTIDNLYASWGSWCRQDGREHTSTKAVFGKDLQAALPRLRRRRGTDQHPFYEGIGLAKGGAA